MQRRPRSLAARDRSRTFGALVIDPDSHEVTVEGRPVELSRTEFEILDALSAAPRVSLSRAQILTAIWGSNWFGDDHVIDVHISNLRRKLGDDSSQPRFIRTVRGFGYRMGAG